MAGTTTDRDRWRASGGASGWYPVNEHPLDKATYTLRVTVPQPYVVAANGLLEATIPSASVT